MDMNFFIIGFGFVFYLFGGRLTALEVTYLKVVDQSKLLGDPIAEQSSISEQRCLFECGLHTGCASINYCEAKQICMLNRNKEDILNILVEEEGWKYYEKYKVRNINVFQNDLVCLVCPVPIHVTFSYKTKINQVKVEANKGAMFSLLFKFLIRIIKGK